MNETANALHTSGEALKKSRDEPSTTGGTLLTASRKVAGLSAGLATDMAGERQLDAEVFKGLGEAGFMRHFVPAAFGGNEGTFGELLPAIVAVGEECTATAWCASLLANTSRFLPLFPLAGQREVWGQGPDAAVVCSVLPFGEAVPEGDGLRVTGRWPYMSAIEFADWLIVCAKARQGGEQRMKLVIVPRSAWQAQDTWYSVGMQATGSNTAVLEDVYVPPERIVDRDVVFAGRAAGPSGDPAVSRVAPLPAVNGLTFVAPALGAARGALALLSGYLGEKVRSAPPLPGMPGVAGNRATYEMVLARSAVEIDTVELLLERIARSADDEAGFPPALIARNMRDSAFAVDVLATVANRIFRTAGTGGQADGGPLQRFWRDINSIATHQALQFEPAARNYTRAVFDGGN
ncbi:hydrolase [Streptomyces sp. MST-110588]|uniref:hydrolase n=1 Tax=Streptomyces sp. MST-110588 TaxID=2833628 RepID=UPI001F5DF2DD|nr:hydrolase [Streptomyces sp. MST-110588]UNO43016.1 hydrolase [Streptomyces sp. MST-110588]